MTIPAHKVRTQITISRDLKGRVDATADALGITPSAVISVYLMQALGDGVDESEKEESDAQ